MKLTKAQLTALEAVERGEVYEMPSIFSRRDNRMFGARKQTVKALREKGLITFMPSAFQGPLYFHITDAGRAALEEVRK